MGRLAIDAGNGTSSMGLGLPNLAETRLVASGKDAARALLMRWVCASNWVRFTEIFVVFSISSSRVFLSTKRSSFCVALYKRVVNILLRQPSTWELSPPRSITRFKSFERSWRCLLYTSDAADDLLC